MQVCQTLMMLKVTRAMHRCLSIAVYRNWINSLGVSPFVHHLYSDLADGLVIFQLYDIVKPGVVNWTRVKTQFHRLRVMMEKIGKTFSHRTCTLQTLGVLLQVDLSLNNLRRTVDPVWCDADARVGARVIAYTNSFSRMHHTHHLLSSFTLLFQSSGHRMCCHLTNYELLR